MRKRFIVRMLMLALIIPTTAKADFFMDDFLVPSTGEDIGWSNNDGDSGWDAESSWDTSKDEEALSEDIEKSNKTIQFTVDNTAKFPVYTDTGIHFTERLSYQTMIEILTQINIKTSGVMLEDTDRKIVLVNGVIVEVKNRDYTFEELEEMFKRTNVSIIKQDSRQNNQFNLADYLETYKQTPLIVKGEKVELFNEPVIENSKVLLPVREVVEGLGAEITSSHDENNKITATIKKGSTVIVVQEGSGTITINNKKIDTGAVSRLVVAKDGERFFANMDDIVAALGGEMYWDAQKKSIVIE